MGPSSRRLRGSCATDGRLRSGNLRPLRKCHRRSGNTSDDACIALVVYDPSAGFVTGGGWIWSPPGALVADSAAMGRANFGFVSRYRKGANVPDGSTQFVFQAGGLNFHSNTYERTMAAKQPIEVSEKT
jgi:hypothetical protein